MWHKPVVIALASSLTQASGKPVRLDNGVPVYKFRGELIRCGKYTTADGVPFSVTPGTLKAWASDFRRMKAAGVPVPMPTNHRLVDHADANRGFVTDMQARGNSLEFTCELYGEDAPRIAVSNHVSLYAEPDWEDGRGNKYEWPIRHVALTPDPRIPGLKRLTISMSNGTTRKAHIARITMAKRTRIKLAGSGTADDPMNEYRQQDATGLGDPNSGTTPGMSVENDPLDAVLDALENDYLPRIREAAEKGERVKLAKEMATKMHKALELFVKEEEEGEDEPEEREDDEAEEAEDREVEDKEDEEEEKEGKEGKEGKDKPPAALSNIHPELIRLSNENRQMRIEKLFESHKITAHQRKQLLAKFTGEGPVRVALSNSAANATFEATLQLLADNQPIRERSTSWQTLDNPLALSNEKEDPETKAALETMHAAVGIKAKK